MNADERPTALLVSAAPRRRNQLRSQLEAEGYRVSAQCPGPDGARQCPGMSYGSCGLTLGAEVVIIDVASVNGVGALRAFYSSRGLSVQTR